MYVNNMAVEAKKKNSKPASTNSNQSSKKSIVSCERKDRENKTTENQNDQKKLIKDQNNRSTFMKSVCRNSVIRTINRTLRFSDVSISQFHKEVIISQIKRFHTSESLSPFDRRVTAISWHPMYPKIFVVGSKGGDLLLHNLNESDDYFINGVGPGGSILGLKCSYENPYAIYTASLTGKIEWRNFQERKLKVLLSLPFSLNNWFTSLDICKSLKCLLTGDCKGNAYLLSTSGEIIWKKNRLHTSKVTHCEFNVHDPNIFVTSSNDHFMKLWDLRSFSSSESKETPLAAFSHLKPVNSAYFSPSNGVNILTTDQHSELRVYRSPLWNEVIKITHPHRHFQHMTQIKAIWHPLEDIIISGRYPDDNIEEKDSRTIDFYDASNGQLLHRIPSPNKNIVSLNAMDSTGEILATAAGFGVSFLKDELLSKGDRYEPKSDDDFINITTNLSKNKKRKCEVKDSKSSKFFCSKKSASSKKISD